MKIKSITKEQNTTPIEFKDIKQWYDENMHPDKLDLDDQDVYKNIYHEGRWGAIFQFTEKGAQRFVQKGKPTSVVDIAALTSIYRPGPLAAKVDHSYVEAKEDPDSVIYEHPLMKECLGETFGLQIFQEQMMKLANVIGKLSLDECDKLRKVILKRSMTGKDKAVQDVDILEEKFVKGAQENGFTETAARKLFDKMRSMSGYCFNKSLNENQQLDVFNDRTEMPSSYSEVFDTKKISDIKPGDKIKSRDEKTGIYILVNVKAVHDHGEQDVFRFTTDNGKTVECTMDHKFRTITGEMLPVWKIIADKLEIVEL